MAIVHILFFLIFLYTLTGVLYLFILALFGKFGRLESYSVSMTKAKIAVLIPSYKEDNIIINTAMQALKQTYHPDKYRVIIIADRLKKDTIKELKKLDVNVVEVEFEKSMKAKSLHAAFNQLPDNIFDLVMILDADNIMEADCLEKVNHAFQRGWKVIQCHRIAKNENNSIAILDAVSEEINNTIFRNGQRSIGFPCALIGSGMAFEFSLIKEIFSDPEIQDNPGEDREIDVQLVKRGLGVEYIYDAYVYDEKVQSSEVFQKQRTRWIATQIDHFKRFMKPDVRNRFLQITYLNKVYQCILLPRVLFILLFLLVISFEILSKFLKVNIVVPSLWSWFFVILAYISALAIAIPKRFYNRRTFIAILKIPLIIISMLKAMFRIRQNKQGFIHTPKEFTGVKNIL